MSDISNLARIAEALEELADAARAAVLKLDRIAIAMDKLAYPNPSYPFREMNSYAGGGSGSDPRFKWPEELRHRDATRPSEEIIIDGVVRRRPKIQRAT